MTVRLFFVLTITLLFTPSCGDNLFYFAEDKGANAVEMSAIDIAFIQGNCEYVKQQYEKRYDVNKPFIDEMDRYRYGTAILACTGYDIVSNLSFLLGKIPGNDNNTQIDVFFNLIGVKGELSLSKIVEYRQAYTKVLEQCTDANITNESFTLMCGFASSADTVMAIAFTTISVSGVSTIPATQTGLNESIRKQGGDPVLLLASFMEGYGVADARFLPDITERDAPITEKAIKALQSAFGDTNFVKILKDMNDGLLPNESTPGDSFIFVIANLLGLT